MKLLIVACACILVVEASVKPVFDKDEKADVAESKAEEKSLFTGRTFSEWNRDFWSWMGYGDYDYYYDDFSNDISGSASSYVSYQHPARDDTVDYFDYVDDTDETSWTDVMTNAAMVMVPLGIILSAIPTGVFTLALRRRSFDDSWFSDSHVDTSNLPLLRAIEARDIIDVLPELAARNCQKKLFCELSKLGLGPNGSYMQKAFYYTSTLTPKFIARRFGLGQLFDVSKTGQCEVLSCSLTRNGLTQVEDLSNKLELPENNLIEESRSN